MKPGKEINHDEDVYLRITKQTWAIFLVSVLGLFLEMLFIRWIGTEVRIFAYLQNTILVACFLGLGLGCFTSRKKIDLRQTLIPLLLLLIVLAIPLSRRYFAEISNLLSVLGDFVIWNNTTTSNIWTTILYVFLGLVMTYFLLILVVDVFVPIGRLLGRLMDDHPDTVWAYSVNVIGSLVGTWLFTVLSILYQPPFTWFVVVGILLLIFVIWTRRGWRLSLALLIAAAALSWLAGLEPGSLRVVWSPYQKLVVEEGLITVNNTGYQSMADLSDAHVASDPGRYSPALQGLSQYDIPLLLHPDPKTYLIVGAGAGNDAAGGLRHGVTDITAVEIDPAIISIGRAFHPENPYSSPAVHIVVNDARSFFATTQMKYDVIAFGLLDSHTTTAMTNARLDHYVYTRESLTQVKSLLAPGGIMVLTFEAQKPFIADRMASVLQEVFGEDPLVFRIPTTAYGWGGVMFVTGDLVSARNQIAQNQRLDQFITTSQQTYPVVLPHTTKIATDDWPYIYLQFPRIPVLYYLLVGLMALIFARSYKKWQASGLFHDWNRSNWHFFFLGAAFLLLEVQNISKASVVLGNTWQVNSVIVSGVLVMALLANWLARKFPRIPMGLVYVLLIATCLALYFVDLARFAFLPYATKAIVIGCLTSLPMLFSGIIFIRSFNLVEEKNTALGANLGGALVGALLQSITFVTGIRALLLIVAGLYFLSLLTVPNLLKPKRTLPQTVK
jgi:spermidine synthase